MISFIMDPYLVHFIGQSNCQRWDEWPQLGEISRQQINHFPAMPRQGRSPCWKNCSEREGRYGWAEW